ncbi:hypothetical protein EAH_00058730 [Eimeria acervulina]|uniref:Uncharacterized protein n=1 Tax=Eimeria acervulina TaxID=5801 RepID=U6G9J9_EIMAC|nr:hypothetical protein EAH_00058730 [Eimeria acervulina]CDI76810.1 hypothetical protein EAH_00058730 [Eimeria acervulina]
MSGFPPPLPVAGARAPAQSGVMAQALTSGKSTESYGVTARRLAEEGGESCSVLASSSALCDVPGSVVSLRSAPRLIVVDLPVF